MEVVLPKIVGPCQAVSEVIQQAINARVGGKKLFAVHPMVHYSPLFQASGKISGVEKYLPYTCNPPGGVLVIPAHGAAKGLAEEALKLHYEIIDGTCSRIKRTQNLIASHIGNVVIIGNSGHQESESLLTYVPKGFKGQIVSSKDEASSLDYSNILVVVQTTFSLAEAEAIVQVLEAGRKISFLDTTCNQVHERIAFALDLTKNQKVEAIIVVGDFKNSSNSKLLLQRIKEEPNSKGIIPVLGISQLRSLERQLRTYRCVGLCGGTSVPDFVYEDIKSFLRNLN